MGHLVAAIEMMQFSTKHIYSSESGGEFDHDNGVSSDEHLIR